MGESKNTISESEAYFIIAFAFVLDLINWIPIVNWLMAPVNWGIFGLYFTIKRVSWPATWGALIAVSSLPFAFFVLTGGVITDIGRHKLLSSKLAIKATI